MKNNLILIASVLFAVLLTFTACQDSSDETGRLSIQVTDAPFPVDLIDEATVTITKVELRSEEESEENPFITVWEGEAEFNLLELRNGVVQELVEVDVPAGAYNLVRIYVAEAGIVVSGEASYSVKVPSGSQSGIKVFIKPSVQISGGVTAEILLDINLDKSFVLKGKLDSPGEINGFNFKPVIRAVNNTIAGSIYGVVKDGDDAPVVGASVTITLDGEESIAYTDENGTYALLGLPPGSFSLIAAKTGFISQTVDVAVEEGKKTEQNFTLELEEEAAPSE